MLRRRCLARLRKEAEPAPPVALARLLPAWQGVKPIEAASNGRGGYRRRSRSGPSGPGAVLDVLDQLAGTPVAASALETLVLPGRIPDYSPTMLDELTTAGEVLWTGAGGLPGGDGWLVLSSAESAPLLFPEPSEITMTPIHEAVLDALADGGAVFFRMLHERVDRPAGRRAEHDQGAARHRRGRGHLGPDLGGPADQRHAGPAADRARQRRPAPDQPGAGPDAEPATGTAVLLRAPGHAVADRAAQRERPLVAAAPGRHRRDPAGARAGPVAAGPVRDSDQGRGGRGTDPGWFLGRLPGAAGHGGRRAGTARLLRRRAGRGAVRDPRRGGPDARAGRPARRAGRAAGHGAERRPVPYRGQASGGDGAFTDLWAYERDGDPPAPAEEPDDRQPGQVIVLAAADPANAYGASLAWPERPDETPGGHRPGRKAGALVILADGELILYVERGGKTLLSWTDDLDLLRPVAAALADAVRAGALGRLTVERADGEGIYDSPLATALEEAGFRPTPKGLRLRG